MNRSKNVWRARPGRSLESRSASPLALPASHCLIVNFIDYWAIALFYLFAVVLAGMRLRRWPTFFLAALSALLWNFLFIPPRFTFYISKFEDFMMFGAYFVIAVVIGHLATQLHEREQAERRREERATALYRLTRTLAASRDLSQALPKVLQLIRDFFQADAAVWLRDENGLTQHPASTLCAIEKGRERRDVGLSKETSRRKINRHAS